MTGSKILAVVLIALVLAGVGFVMSPDQLTSAETDQVCTAELGDEWESSAVAMHEEWTHYHVECERSTGFLRSESKWVTVPAERLDG